MRPPSPQPKANRGALARSDNRLLEIALIKFTHGVNGL
jgi:hypothetical protein